MYVIYVDVNIQYIDNSFALYTVFVVKRLRIVSKGSLIAKLNILATCVVCYERPRRENLVKNFCYKNYVKHFLLIKLLRNRYNK